VWKIVENFFEKTSQKIWSLSKMAIPLHRFSLKTGREAKGEQEFFDMFATRLT